MPNFIDYIIHNASLMLGQWDSHVYQTYIDKADIDHQDWEDITRNGVVNVVEKLNLNMFGCLT